MSNQHKRIGMLSEFTDVTDPGPLDRYEPSGVGGSHPCVPPCGDPVGPAPGRQPAIVTAGLLLSGALVALDTSIVATAMPTIVADLSGLALYAWVTAAYLVASTTTIPISGKLGDLFGRKRFIQVGMIGFVVA